MNDGQIAGIEKPLSRLVQGTIMLNTQNQSDSERLLDAAYDYGINVLDTAHAYGNGESERSIGRWMEKRGNRDKVVIVGKGAHPNKDRERVTTFDISSDIHDSLARLRTDHIDLYLLHRDDPALPVGPLLERLHEHRIAGHIRAYGTSNWKHERIKEANLYASRHGIAPFVASSPNFSLAYQSKDPWDGCVSISGPQGEEARQWYASEAMPLLTWSSLAGGFFSGRFRRDNLDSFDGYFDRICVEVYCFEENWRRLERAQELAAAKGVSTAQVALAYVMNQPLNMFAIAGAHNESEIKDNVSAASLQLSADELSWLLTGQ